jgi:cytochrome bd-type quinol oxidase subunit 1
MWPLCSAVFACSGSILTTVYSPSACAGVAIFVVEKAPCFLCIRMKHSTYRSILLRLNILCAFFAATQVASATWLYIVMRNPNIVNRVVETETEQEHRNASSFELVTNTWNVNGAVLFLGVAACIILVAITLTYRVIQNGTFSMLRLRTLSYLPPRLH